MTDRTVSVRLQAKVTDYLAGMSAASKATSDFATKVDAAKARSAQGFHTIGLAGVAMGTVVAGGFALAIKSAANFEAKMALVRTLSHATAGEMKQLSDAALHIGQAYGFSASQVADAEAELVKAGVSVKDMMGGDLRGALTLASAGQTDVATATTIAATAMTQFGLKGKDVPHIADLLAAGADKALGSVVDLGYALDQAGPQAHQFHVSIEETVGTLAAFAQAGQIGERGGTIFTQMLLKLAAPGKQSSDILKQLGISIYGTNGQFVGMANLAGQLQSKMSGLTEAERNHDLAVIFGQRAIRGANILYQDGAKGIQDWTDKVNAQGFAALQASGKLDSLSGDVTKLKTALQTAFIGVGEGGQGPLRGATQDVTKFVDAWNGLPGPVRGGAVALTAVAGATALAGGAALLLIPKYKALDTALTDMSGGAMTASGALATLGRAAGIAAALVVVYEATSKLANLVGPTAPNLDRVTVSLQNYATTGVAAGQMTQDFGAHLKDLGEQIKKVAAPSTFQSLERWSRWNPIERIAGTGADLAAASKNIGSYDTALSGLVRSGQASAAADFWKRISSAAQAQGISVDRLVKIFPKYGLALSQSAASAKAAGTGIDQYGNAVSGAAKKTKEATDAAKAYSDRLHALADPLFAMNQALQGVTDAQAAATAAVRRYGANSPQAKKANLDLASSALDAEAAARTLASSVQTGSVSIGDARKFLQGWVADGLLTQRQAQDISSSFGFLIGQAQTISGLHPHMTVTADTSQAENALSQLLAHIGQVISAFFTLGSVSTHAAPPAAAPGARRTDIAGAPIPKTPTTTTTPKVTLPYTPSSGGGSFYTPSGTGGAGGGGSAGSGGGGGSGVHPPTTAEIVHAILTGTIPPSIDKLSKVLQHEIRHLSSVVSHAQQQRTHAQTALDSVRQARGQMASGITSSLLSSVDLGGAYVNGRVGNLSAFIGNGIKPLAVLARDEALLRKKGLDPALLAQIAGAGPIAGAALAQQILTGGSGSIAHLNAVERRARNLAKATGVTVSTATYAKQIAGHLQRLNDVVDELKLIKGIMRANPKATGHELAIEIDHALSVAQHKQQARAGR